MDAEQRARKQSRRVIISEIIMLLAVVATVLVLVLIVSGYWLGSDFKVERQGLLQVSSLPTGANVEIDGTSSWLQRTNTSKVLSSGEHTVLLTKDGYDTWTKNVTIKEGLLYRLHYPRLFLKERNKETVYDATTTTYATVSPNRNNLLLANNTTTWKLINLDSEKLEAKNIDISKVFSSVETTADSATGLFNGQIIDADWDSNSEHILFKVKTGESYEWAVLDIRNPANSINVTRVFAAQFDDMIIYDNSASNLLAIRNGNLHKIDLSSRQISAIIVEKVHSFDHFESEIVFVADYTPAEKTQAEQTESNTKQPQESEGETATSEEESVTASYYVGLVKYGNDKKTVLRTLDQKAEVTISKFYDDKYVTLLADNNIKLFKLDDFKEILSKPLTFSSQDIKVGHAGEFVTIKDGAKIATLDMEAMSVREWEVTNASFGWLDEDMIYSVNDGELSVYDFDGFNHRILSHNVSSHFPVTITGEKWLYYFSDGSIIRETISN